MDNNFSNLRKSTFGGFNRKDVVSYIERVRNVHYSEKSKMEKEISELKAQLEKSDEIIQQQAALISEWESRVASALEEKQELKEMAEKLNAEILASAEKVEENPVSEINQATSRLRDVADELCNSLKDFIERISENSYSLVIESKPADGFDGKKILDEIEAQLQAEFDGAAAEEIEETESAEAQAQKDDEMIGSILSSIMGFAVEKEEAAEKAEDEAVSSILSGLSFLE